MNNILIVGSGGREHALGWKLSQSNKVNKIYFAPGNGGTSINIDIQVDDVDQLLEFAINNNCFTIVGPEVPLKLGIVDKFLANNLKIFGPTQIAAKLETSKSWAKNFMQKYNIPTAKFEIFDNYESAIKHVRVVSYPIVIKADGLASGKGVFICNNFQDSSFVLDKMFLKHNFGNAGNKILIEEYLHGRELSYIILSDGETIIPMETSKDYKRIFDRDKGDNTGGMGSYSPADIDIGIQKQLQQMMKNVIHYMKNMGMPFVGFLYAGIIIHNNIPYVLEFNARMGDPECQSIMMRLQSDLYDYLLACVNGKLANMPKLNWNPKHAVCVVLASDGYPNNYSKHEIIYGCNSILDCNNMIFHAGTRKINDVLTTNGGRVLGVVGLDNDRKLAATRAYNTSRKIKWKSKYNRTDIGYN